MLDPKELRVQLQNIYNAPIKYFGIDLSDLPRESVPVDPGVKDAANEIIVRRDIAKARLRGEKRMVRPTGV